MKKLFLLLLILPLGFYACGDDDDPDYSKDIVGTWSFYKVTNLTIETNNKQMNTIIKESMKDTDLSEMIPSDFTGTYIFDDAGEYQSLEGNTVVERGTYTLNGSTLKLQPENQAAQEYTIDINTNKMKITLDLPKAAINEIINDWAQEDPEFLVGMQQAGITINKVIISIDLIKK